MGKFAILFLLTVTFQAWAGQDVCFTDLRTYQAVRAQLPAVLKSPVIFAVHESGMMFGGVRIQPEGNQFVIEAKAYSKLGGRVHELSKIVRTCVNADKVRVLFENGDEDTIRVTDGGLKMRGFTFASTTRAKYIEVVARIPEKGFFENEIAFQ